MKRIALALFCALAGFTAPAHADVRVSFDFFHESLQPYGEWVRVGDYGPVWHPSDVDEEWAPYTDGYWAYTDGGWTWVSYEEWGGITYHYGRWTRVGGMGWCWVPGYEWGPAWVSWRRSDDYIGWAPLPPEARWRHHTGFSNWVDVEFGIGPAFFRFCHARDFGAPVIRGVCLPPARNVTIINQTVNITNITYRNDRGHAFNGGPDYDWVAPRSRQPVPKLKLVQNTTNVFVKGNRGNVFVNSQKGNTLVVGAPPVARDAATASPRLAGIKRSIPAPEIDRGWAALKNDPARESIAAKFKEETKGLTSKTAPARAFNPEQVAMVPKKADPKAMPAVLVKAPATQPVPVPPPASVPQKPGQPVAGKPAEPPQPAVIPPAEVTDSKGKSKADNSPKTAVVQQPGAPVVKAPRVPPKPAPAPVPEVKSPPYVPPLPGKPKAEPAEIQRPGAPVVKAPQVVPKPAPAPVAEVKSPPYVPPLPGTPKAEPAERSGRAQTVQPGRSQAEAAEKALEQQRNAEAANRKQAALDEQRRQQAAMEKEQRAAANAATARRQEEAARQAGIEQQRAAIAAQQRKEMQRQEAAEAARRQAIVPPKAPVEQPIRRPVEIPRQVDVPRQQIYVPKAPQPAPAGRPPGQSFGLSSQVPRQLERSPVGRPAAPVPQDPRNAKGKSTDERK